MLTIFKKRLLLFLLVDGDCELIAFCGACIFDAFNRRSKLAVILFSFSPLILSFFSLGFRFFFPLLLLGVKICFTLLVSDCDLLFRFVAASSSVDRSRPSQCRRRRAPPYKLRTSDPVHGARSGLDGVSTRSRLGPTLEQLRQEALDARSFTTTSPPAARNPSPARIRPPDFPPDLGSSSGDMATEQIAESLSKLTALTSVQYANIEQLLKAYHSSDSAAAVTSNPSDGMNSVFQLGHALKTK